jgi:hypothetical protein
MQEMHDPTNTEHGSHETAKAVQAVAHTFSVRALRDQPENHARNQREQNRRFKMSQIQFHGSLIFLLRGDFVRVHHGKNIQQSRRHQELGSIIGRRAGNVRLRVAEPNSQ